MEGQVKSTDVVFTIGHSNHLIDNFLGLLRQHHIDVLVDTRSSPFSKYSPQFDQDRLRGAVTDAGKAYYFLGRELGGKPKDSIYYDTEGYVLYWKIAETQLFHEGIEKVKKASSLCTVALLCSEENPIHCHRRLLVGRVLRRHCIELIHIRGNSSLQSESELELLDGAPVEQMTFFPKPSEDQEWKSIQSVSQRKPQLSSLNR